jgi:integrase
LSGPNLSLSLRGSLRGKLSHSQLRISAKPSSAMWAVTASLGLSKGNARADCAHPGRERLLRIPIHCLQQTRSRRASISLTLGIKVHAHMLRHACGYKLANDGHDTRAIQAYLGHRNIQNTTRYTALAPQRFKEFFRD